MPEVPAPTRLESHGQGLLPVLEVPHTVPRGARQDGGGSMKVNITGPTVTIVMSRMELACVARFALTARDESIPLAATKLAILQAQNACHDTPLDGTRNL